MAEFKTGDTVRLKSGGPLMTVSTSSASGGVDCYWFNQSGSEYTSKWETYRAEMLKTVDTKSG